MTLKDIINLRSLGLFLMKPIRLWCPAAAYAAHHLRRPSMVVESRNLGLAQCMQDSPKRKRKLFFVP